nr:MAG TPA: hypothetical protein [Caudoviricetes sp.]
MWRSLSGMHRGCRGGVFRAIHYSTANRPERSTRQPSPGARRAYRHHGHSLTPNPAALPQGGNLNPPCHPVKFHNSLRL